MLILIKKLFTLLTPGQRKRFYGLQILVIIMAFTEIIGVVSIIPFMALVGDMNQLQQNTIIAQVYQVSGTSSESQFVLLLGLSVLVLLLISSIISILTIWKISMFANKIGVEIADRLYSHYLKQDWLFHASGSSAQLTKKIAIETARVTHGVLVPLMQMNAKIILSLFMSISIFIFDPKVALIGFFTFTLSYFFLFKVVRVRLHNNGTAISDTNEERFRLMNEGFGGIKDVILLGRDNDFINRFNETGKTLAYSHGTNAAFTSTPRYFIELIAFGSMISLILYLMVSHEGNLGMILPILSVYALVAIKLLPAFQQIYSSIATMNGNIAAFDSIEGDLDNSLKAKSAVTNKEESHLQIKQEIKLENITFTFPKKEEPALNQLNITIPVNSLIGIVGPSGSGKSTLIDILLALIDPQQGELKVDNNVINKKNRRSWQNTIGFVAQSIFLSQNTIAENVAFGIPKDQINLEQVSQALKLAHLTELLESLKDGIHTQVGERGVQLSGGQRQRIGIARALYHKAEVLVFDEATSSLDGITEKMIMEAIYEFSGQKTIILVAHRLKTVEKCDNIFFIDKGKVIDQGTYQELIKKNEKFKKIADHA
jgi:ATP-binding cassette, subfamily B, bacterial PglK